MSEIPNGETEEEVVKLEGKQSALTNQANVAIGRLLRAGSEEEAKTCLYEYLFILKATEQVTISLGRLLGEYEFGDEEFRGDTLKRLDYCDELVRDGDWTVLKGVFYGATCRTYGDLVRLGIIGSFSKNLGFDEDFTYEGIPFMQSSVLIPVEWQVNRFELFVVRQLALIPDKTEPWEHPNIEELKASIS